MTKRKEPAQKDLYTHYDSEGVISEGKLNEVIIKVTPRINSTPRIQQDFSFCPTLTEQHSAHMSDINYLIQKYKPDELAAYIAARAQHRQEILGHDFSNEPTFQDAKNTVYRMRQAFEELDPDIKNQFKNHIEFLKFIDNPANQEKMLKLGLLKKKEIAELTTEGTATGAKADLSPDASADPSKKQ